MSLAAFVLFVRFHVFLAIFSAAILGVWAASGRGWVPRVLIIGVLVTGMAVEAVHTLDKPERWGRWVYYREIEELTQWMRRYVRPEPVLANFGVSASILTYGECPILLHPKFESKEIRDRVRAYGETLFKGTEEELRDWANRYGAQYYVYALGEFSSISPEQQMRYFVNALNPATNCPARLFEFDTGRLTCFRFLWGNRKYRVFKILNGEEDAVAKRFSDAAEKALERGRSERGGRPRGCRTAGGSRKRAISGNPPARGDSEGPGIPGSGCESDQPMKKGLSIGLTGGIACGKSEVGRILEREGAQVRDADELAHELIRYGGPLFDKVVERFGAGIVGRDGEIDRQILGRRVFADAADRKALESPNPSGSHSHSARVDRRRNQAGEKRSGDRAVVV